MPPVARITAGDAALTGAVLVAALVAAFGLDGQQTDRPLLSATLAVVASLPFLWRRRWPLAVLAVSELVFLVFLVAGSGWRAGGPAGPAMAVALYTVAAHRPRRVSVPATAVLLAANTVALVLAYRADNPAAAEGMIAGAVAVCGAWLVGDDIRLRRAYTAEVEARLAAVVRERAAQTHRAVAEERARIARDLHDIVAHHVSGMTVRAFAAAEQVPPGPGREALDEIGNTGRQAMSELRGLVGLLGTPAGQGTAPRPQPGLDDIPGMVGRFNGDEVRVDLTVEGPARPVPAAVGSSAYRIVQEALSNARRHAAPTDVRVVLGFGADRLRVEVVDRGRLTAGVPLGATPAGDSSTGRGLIGMRERVALFAGELSAGPTPEGGFRVAASLPVDGRHG